MKRLLAIAALSAVISIFAGNASAQGTVIKGGFNYSRFTPEVPGGYNGWYAGIAYQTYSRAGFSFQPELIYRVNGASLSDASTLRMNYIEIPFNIQWGVDLLVAKPFIFASPFVGYNLSSLISTDGSLADISVRDAVSDINYGVGAGFGINVWKLQLSAKYNWQFGKVADWGRISPDLSDLDINMATFELSVGFKL